MINFPPNFSLKELTTSQTAIRKDIDNTPDDERLINLVQLAWWLQGLRDSLKEHYSFECPINISSGFRCKELNYAIGGSKTSAHMEGLAADITCPYITPYNLALFIQNHLSDMGFDQVIHEFGRWVHIGLRHHNQRFQSLTAKKVDKKTIYVEGIEEVL